jgi:hypothetical protein
MRNSHNKESIHCLMHGVVLLFLRKMCWHLQNYTDAENVLVGPYGGTYPTSHDANQAMNVQVKEGSDVEEEDDPVPISFPEIKAEPEVSCMCTVTQITKCAEVVVVFLIPISVSSRDETTPLAVY